MLIRRKLTRVRENLGKICIFDGTKPQLRRNSLGPLREQNKFVYMFFEKCVYIPSLFKAYESKDLVKPC